MLNDFENIKKQKSVAPVIEKDEIHERVKENFEREFENKNPRTKYTIGCGIFQKGVEEKSRVQDQKDMLI